MTVASVIEEPGALARIEDPPQADGRRAALLDAAGMAQGHAPRARLDVGGMAHLDVRPLAGVGDLGEAGIAREVRAQGLGRGTAAVGEDDRQFAARLGDHVADGHDQAVFAHHDAAALAQAALACQPLVDNPHGCRQDPRGHLRLLASTRLSVATVVGSAARTGDRDEIPEQGERDEKAKGGRSCFWDERRARRCTEHGDVPRKGGSSWRASTQIFSIVARWKSKSS